MGLVPPVEYEAQHPRTAAHAQQPAEGHLPVSNERGTWHFQPAVMLIATTVGSVVLVRR